MGQVCRFQSLVFSIPGLDETRNKMIPSLQFMKYPSILLDLTYKLNVFSLMIILQAMAHRHKLMTPLECIS